MAGSGCIPTKNSIRNFNGHLETAGLRVRVGTGH